MKKFTALLLVCIVTLSVGITTGFARESTELDAETLYNAAYQLKNDGHTDLAYELFFAAADLDSAEALLQLGEMYLAGWIPVEEGEDNRELALSYWKLAMERNVSQAFTNMGLLYYNTGIPGTGGADTTFVEQDYDKAFEYFSAAAELNNGKSWRYMGYCYEFGHGVEADLEMAAFYYSKAGSVYYANVLFDGLGIEQDIEQAIEVYTKAAERTGHNRKVTSSGGPEGRTAALTLGKIYENGINGVEVDMEKARYFYEIAAWDGQKEAQAWVAEFVANLYSEGIKLFEAGNYAEAMPLLWEAADLGDQDALNFFGAEEN